MENQKQDNKPETIEKFTSIIQDFCRDLSTTFPEFSHLWQRWQLAEDVDKETAVRQIQPLYDYCLEYYPQRFFDILYQNDDLFTSQESNTFFLPDVDFKILFSCPDISDNTRQTMWKYLQLIMITIMGNIESSASFGDAASIFEGILEEDLEKKLAETVGNVSEFFKNMATDENTPSDFGKEVPDFEKAFEDFFKSKGEEGGEEGGEGESKGFDFSSMPNPEELNEHLKGIFDGKIGSLAKELAEELSDDVLNMCNADGSAKTSGDVLKQLMKNPKQIMDLIKKVGGKLDQKMKDGNITQEELMKEAGDLLSKMKGSGNEKDFQNMMKDMMKNMSPMMASMMGKKGKMDTSKMQNEFSKMSYREKMKQKLEQRKAMAKAQAQFNLQQTEKPNEFVFKGEEQQEKSSATRPTDDWLCSEPSTTSTTKPKAKGKKGKKK
jgi:hypothetical protein